MADGLKVSASLTGRRWTFREGEDRIGLGIAQRLNLPEMLGRLLAARGIGLDTAAHFLEPTLRALLPDPSVLGDMDVAADRLARAVQASETVAVFGVYDVDGACSSAIMVTTLPTLGCTVLHRHGRLLPGEAPALRSIRFRTLGCYPLTGAVESGAATLDAVIAEMLATTTSERMGRAVDGEGAASMEMKKQEGYF